MPQQHFRCPRCAIITLLAYRSADVDNPAVWPPACEGCADQRLERAPQPGDFAIDAMEPFQRFDVWRQGPNGQQQRETVDSLHKVRALEQDSEQRYANGEGEPLRFRGYSQDRSNIDQMAFGNSGTIGGRAYANGQAPTKKRNIGVKRHGEHAPTVKAARGAGKSALG